MNRIPFLILAFLVASSCDTKHQKPDARQPQMQSRGIEDSVPEFDGTKAFSMLTTQTDFGPRSPNSAGHRRCLKFLQTELSKYADATTVQEFTHSGYEGEKLQLANIFASFNPRASTRILLVAHWDTRPRAEMESDPLKKNSPILGANDAASGVAVLLELARLMKRTSPPVGVDILMLDGEDYGKSKDLERYSLGARHFMKTKSPNYAPSFGILLDMVGDRDLEIPIEQNSLSYASRVVDLLWATAGRLGVSQFVNKPGEQVFDDHVPLNEGGIPTVDIIDFQYPYWHTLDDTPDKCSPESLEAVGKVLAHVIYSSERFIP